MLFLGVSSLLAASSGQSPPALVIDAGSVAHSQVVAVGRDLRVAGQAESDVVSIHGSATVTGSVKGDVIVLGGDAVLAESARIGGDVLVLGGQLKAAAGSRILGRSVSYPTLGAAWLTLLEGPSLGLAASSPVVLGAKLALLAAWLTLSLILLATDGRQVLNGSRQIAREPARDFLIGFTGVLSLLLTALFFSAFASAIVGLPLLALVVLIALLLKLWGMVAVFHCVGAFVTSRWPGRRLQPLNQSMIGLGILGAIKLIPWVGTWVWTVATFIAVGATLATKFGRSEPWFDAVPDFSHTSAR